MFIKKSIGLFQICLCIVFFQTINSAQKLERDVLQTVIQGEKIRDKTLSTTLSNIAVAYKIPIGFEPTTHDLSDTKEPFITENKNMTKTMSLSNFLDEIVRLNPKYNWNYSDGVIHVFPVSDKDEKLDEILETIVDSINYRENKCKTALSGLIFGDVNVKNKAQSLNVKSFQACDASSYVEAKPELLYKQTFGGVSVRNILDRVVKETSFKYWTIFSSDFVNDFVNDKNVLTISTH